jgi:hypothetical protein
MRLLLVLLAALGGAAIGAALDLAGWFPTPATPPPSVKVYPLPHHLPKYPGGISLRFAMVHDVIHERFPRHGKAYYTARNRQVRQSLASLSVSSETPADQRDRYFTLLDDLGVGLDQVSEHDEAVRVLRDKLASQQALGLKDRALYATYANLGTSLIHGNFGRARDGDRGAREHLREGLAFIHKSIEVNPQAHFGREIWQAVAAEFFLAVMDNPQLLLRFDMVGNRLDATLDTTRMRDVRPGWDASGGAATAAAYLADPEEHPFPGHLRQFILLVGASQDWAEEVPTSHKRPVPFDEPTLGIIGMWRLGGGANPHFALALGEIMLRVGQRYIAWCAYERAVLLQERFWPDADLRRQFVEHCRARQAFIEQQLPESDRAELRPRFQTELAVGQKYQQDYQAYEAERLAAGASPSDPHFHDAFHAAHGPIASPPGRAEQYRVVHDARPPRLPLPAMVFCAGVFAFATATLLGPLLHRRPASP